MGLQTREDWNQRKTIVCIVFCLQNMFCSCHPVRKHRITGVVWCGVGWRVVWVTTVLVLQGAEHSHILVCRTCSM